MIESGATVRGGRPATSRVANRAIDALDVLVLRVVSEAPAGLSAAELIRALGVQAFPGYSTVSRTRRAAATLLSLAGSGLLLRSAGRTARYTITGMGLDGMREAGR